jgi:predicted nucleic acid-binding protein
MADLFDTDVLIDYLRAHPDAVSFVEARIEGAFVSALTAAEIYQGMRKSEESSVVEMFSAFTVLPVTAEIARLGGAFSRDYRASHGCGLADYLIAATAELQGLTLHTRNKKHFPMLKDTNVPYATS